MCSVTITGIPFALMRFLAVTDVRDLADYIGSLSGMVALREIPREEMTAVLTAHMKDGVLSIPKEYGMFTAR